MIRIILAEDHALMRRGLRLILESHSDIEVAGEAQDGREALDLVEALEPDVAILDVGMPNLNGIEAARQISANHPGVGVLMISVQAEEENLWRALRAGARGYLSKESSEPELVQAVRVVSQGQVFFSPTVNQMVVNDYIRQLQAREQDDSYELLSQREREILQLVAEGRSNKEIAASLNLSVYTIETHRSNIMKKLNVKNVHGLIRYALRKKIVA